MNDEKELMGHVAMELIEGIQKKDRHAVMDALSALINHIQSEDQMQDEGESHALS